MKRNTLYRASTILFVLGIIQLSWLVFAFFISHSKVSTEINGGDITIVNSPKIEQFVFGFAPWLLLILLFMLGLALRRLAQRCK